MERLFLLLLFTVCGLASCNRYSPKNDLEEALLTHIADSFNIDAPVTEFAIVGTDTHRVYKKDYEDRLRRILPNSPDPLKSYDSMKLREQELMYIPDDIEHEQYLAEHHSADNLESLELSQFTILHYELVEEYREFLALGVDSVVTIAVDCEFVINEMPLSYTFLVTGDGKRVISSYPTSLKH